MKAGRRATPLRLRPRFEFGGEILKRADIVAIAQAAGEHPAFCGLRFKVSGIGHSTGFDQRSFPGSIAKR